ncbi:hypothetical protein SDC9_53171 [bioreactor metagenome]|uniref:Purine catabolism regulatory protein n=1 Tax=bioreactor metagenome TaxID=1076179 RepID=A0A644WTS7_9ZZZZ
MAFTVAKMLKLAVFCNSKVLAGNKGVNRIVTGVTILESTDFNTCRMKNEIVLTSTFFLRLFEKSGVNYIVECQQRMASGICIKPNIADTGFPEDIVNAAERLRFPIIVLTPNVDLQQVISAITYETLRRDGYDIHLSFEENFFQELIVSDKDRDSIIKRGAMIGLGKDELLCALLIQPSDVGIAKDVCDFCLCKWERKCYTLTKNGRVMVALRLTIAEDNKDFVLEIAKTLLKKLEAAMAPNKFRIGIGRNYKEPAQFNKSFFEACNALSVSQLNRSRDPVSHFTDLGIFRILFDYKNREELFQLYRETVGTIIEYDQKNETEYLNTIRTYLNQKCSVNNTAKKLFVHYNTINYRINKIKSLFGIDLDNEEDRMNLYVGIKTADCYDLNKLI